MAGDDAGDGLLVGHPLTDADRHLLAGPEPAARRGVIDLDPCGAHPQQTTGLEDPRKLLGRCAAEAAEEDRLERLALVVVGAFIDIEVVVPG